MAKYSGTEIIDLYLNWQTNPSLYQDSVFRILSKISHAVVSRSKYAIPRSHEDLSDLQVEVVYYLFRLWKTKLVVTNTSKSSENQRLFCYLRSKANYYLIERCRSQKKIYSLIVEDDMQDVVSSTGLINLVEDSLEQEIVDYILSKRNFKLNERTQVQMAKKLNKSLPEIKQTLDNLIERISVNEIFNSYVKN